ncbi:MAG: hypothetical protein HZC22_18610 [Rhodocyclales bacterium]|nr:hypothetical protein [Rhodocyclales bacterium]MBI5792242.1 hypothetical protein [Rhodocyclales bacterium]
MDQEIPNGTLRVIDGRERSYTDGYWIKTYPVPDDTLQGKRRLIEALTRRLFNHTEHGLDIPGHRLAEARQAYQDESDPGKKRVKGAMYAGAMFNRATDIFTRLVELQAAGVEISTSNDLMRECGRCLQEALSLCSLVLHRSGEEGIDELWGETFRAFSSPLPDFYAIRYVKMAQAMRDIDTIADTMARSFATPMFPGIEPTIRDFARAARNKVETLRTDRDIFDIWAEMVTAGERLASFRPVLENPDSVHEQRVASFGNQLICNGRDLIFHITRARVSMPKSTREFVERCETYAATGIVTTVPIPLPR